MLQEYLNENLLTLTDDSHFDKLKKTANELAKKHLKNKHKILSYTMSVLDSNATLENQDIDEVKELIAKSWNTFLNNVKDTPITYVKVVMLQALSEVANDLDNAAIIWYGSRNILHYYTVSDKELGIIKPFIISLGEKIESSAISEWSIARLSFPETFLRNFKFSAIDKVKLENHLKAASASAEDGGENPVSVTEDNTWYTFFSKRAAQGISEESLLSLQSVANKLASNDSALADFVTSLKENVQASRLRSQLLWWKESGYSESIKTGYEEIPEGIRQSALSFDYASFLPSICPVSTEFFLKRTHDSVGSDRKITFKEFLDLVELNCERFKQIYQEPILESPKISLLEFLQGLVWKRIKTEDFELLMGIPSKAEIQLREITLWLFHDHQIAKLIANKK